MAFVALFMSSCGEREQTVRVKKVKTAEVLISDSAAEISFPAKVISDDKYNVSFKVAGRIASVPVEEGIAVSKGQLIATLDDRDYRVAFDAAQAEYNSVKAEAERVIAIYNDSATAANNYDKAVYGLKQVTAKLDHARDQLNDTKIYAPVSGIVKNVYHRHGEVIGAGMPVVEIVDDSRRLVEIKIPASDYVRRSDFRSFSCRFAVYPDRVFALEPFSESPVANANQLYTVKLRFKDGQGALPTIGMTTSVNITVASDTISSGEYKVPVHAVCGMGTDEAWIYTIRPDSLLEKVPVSVVSLSGSGMAEIIPDRPISGMSVVAAGVSSLREGQKVSPLPEETTTNVGGLL